MNRREAIAALTSLPVATRITSVPATSDDVIVVEYPSHRLTQQQQSDLRAQLQQVWPNRKIVVLSGGTTIKLMPS